MWLHWLIRFKIAKVDTVLDIGCGIRPQNIIKPRTHICCDPYKPYLEDLRDKEADKRYVLLHADWEKAINIFLPKSIDTIFLLGVIEHVAKKKAVKLLEKTEKIARKQIVIYTPLGFSPQNHPDGIDAWGMKGGKWQEHLSGWELKDFGDSWQIFACKNYIQVDNVGKKLEKPCGAFWAIKNYVS